MLTSSVNLAAFRLQDGYPMPGRGHHACFDSSKQAGQYIGRLLWAQKLAGYRPAARYTVDHPSCRVHTWQQSRPGCGDEVLVAWFWK